MKKAFTLVELLVVIGIIAVLMAILVASLSGSTDSANATKCLANMRSLAIGCQAVALSTEHYPSAGSHQQLGEVTFSAGSAQQQASQHRGWIAWNTVAASGAYISPYANDRDAREMCLTNGTLWTAVNQNRSAYVCPMHRKAADKKLKGALPEGPAWSYVMNAYFDWDAKGRPYWNDHRGRWAKDFKRADRILLFAELPFLAISGVQNPTFSQGPALDNDPVLQYDGNGGSGKEIIGFNHRLGKRETYAHVCFADGHTAKFLLPKNPSQSNLRDLTKWLCNPKDSSGKYFDVTFANDTYQKVQ